MLGIRFIKFDAMTYVIHYKKGRVAREGRGLAFYYYEPSSSIAAIPLGSNDVPFIFNETTLDYQTISVQGQVSYRVSDAKKNAPPKSEGHSQMDCFNVSNARGLQA